MDRNLEPWEELEWIGKIVQIGNIQFDIVEPVQRCMATTANPETGVRDADTLGALQGQVIRILVYTQLQKIMEL